MEKRLWFKAKTHGWGWYPASWQGWLVTLAAIGLITWNAVLVDATSHSASDALIGSLGRTFVIVGALILIAWKTGERPSWRWGGKEIFKK